MFRLCVPTTEPLPDRGKKRLLAAVADPTDLTEYFRQRRQLVAGIKSAYVHSETNLGAYEAFLPWAGAMVALADAFDEQTRDAVQKFHFTWSTASLRHVAASDVAVASHGNSGAGSSSSGATGPKPTVLSLKSARFELVMIVASLGMQHWAMAHAALDDSAQAAGDGGSAEPTVAALKAAYTSLRAAAGVFIELERLVAAFVDAPDAEHLPLEATPAGATLLIEWARAEAEACLLFSTTLEGKVSGKLAARIAASVAVRFGRAADVATNSGCDSAILPYLTMRGGLARATALRHQAAMASEAGEHGVACAYIDMATEAMGGVVELLASIKSSKGLLSSVLGGGNPAARFRALVPLASSEVKAIEAAAKSYHHDNDNVYYEPVPKASTLELAEAASVAAPTELDMPPPAFVDVALKPEEESTCCIS
ncbi:uncharacterized protein AMSG_05810 [Thecamonas trahens ATCC 50062]|uniref:BRO1 domain-containing protein n=1 Tax=Thecamonas trahens ATCC 50062 TaxID=461836 RepID=A0A0L0DCI6_THETB|nr:hypothetical protein AMSG_05810 [Thecamonas trahens ATCC 50062]KNC50049.1 hypothetical protein AMSG_05810 [Thecamonas trahens ATCC 50062]|eukprot:XP_013757215.1 hypothetical protein AMSG_05810 [Thecamonas trahens ATCC 50062]